MKSKLLMVYGCILFLVLSIFSQNALADIDVVPNGIRFKLPKPGCCTKLIKVTNLGLQTQMACKSNPSRPIFTTKNWIILYFYNAFDTSVIDSPFSDNTCPV